MDHPMVVDAKNSTFSTAILIFGIYRPKHHRSTFLFPDSYSVDNLAIENTRLPLIWLKKALFAQP